MQNIHTQYIPLHVCTMFCAAGWIWDVLWNVSLWSVNLGHLCNAAESFCNILQSLQPALWSNIKCFRVFPLKYIQNIKDVLL